MKLTEIQIDRHGIWSNLTLPVAAHGLSVFYGPNEGGKSSLRKFIRGVLFGFSSHSGQQGPGRSELPVDGRYTVAGSLQVEDASGTRRIHRASTAGSAGDARLITDEAAVPFSASRPVVTAEIDEQLFDRVFAVDLRELSEINSLSGDDVARHLFGLSLGSRGQQIIEAQKRIANDRQKLVAPLDQSGDLLALFAQRAAKKERLNDLGSLRDRHTEWSLRRDQLDREIADLRGRQAGTGEQLRGHVFLERAWGPWNRIREYKTELTGLTEIADFPERGLERLDKLENEIAAAAECRDSLVAEVRQLRNEILHPAEGILSRRNAATVQGLVDQRGWLAALKRQCDAAQFKSDECLRELEAACERLGADWSATRVAAANVSTAAERRLSGTAESFRAAVARRKAIRRARRRLQQAYRQLSDSLAESLHDLEGGSVEAAQRHASARIARIEKAAALKVREAELGQRLESLEQEHERIAPHLNLPHWVHIVLGVFAFMGVMLAGWGLVAGVAVSGIAGAIYAMLGITCGGLAWGLKIQYEGDADKRLAGIASSISATRRELAEVRRSISELAQGTAKGNLTEQLIEANHDIAALAQLAAEQNRLAGLRKKRVALRKKLDTAHLEVGTARQSWNDLLAKIGFPQTFSTDEALAAWQLLADASERMHAWQEAQRELQLLEGIWGNHRQRIVELARRIDSDAAVTDEPLDILAHWEELLVTIDRRRDELQKKRAGLRVKQREAAEFRKRVEEVKLKRNALLLQGGAASRDEFEERARTYARSTFLEDQLQEAENDLDAACTSHTDLALVEEDLEQFDAAQNSECIETLRMELADLDRDLDRAREHLGSVKREIDALENDGQSTQLRFEIAQLDDQLRALAGEWVVCEAAAHTIDELRRDFEREHQPAALADAAKLFARLTSGKYRSLWAPLGERRLLVSDDQGRTFPVQSLSRGTREQLLLAVRLAIVSELSRQGISLPMVLDDVIVNFDEDRARAAVELLRDLAATGQQILFFTCHKHLADLFAAQGIAPIHLPDHAAVPPSDEHRLAG